MPDPGERDLLGEWRRLVDSLVGSATAAAGRAPIPQDLVKVSQRQLELLQEVIERERRRQGELAAIVTAPLDAVFDLLEETGQTLRLQAEALQAAGRALEETAGLMKRQSERFERTVGALRQPAEFAKAAAGARRKPKPKASTGAKTGPGAKASARPKASAGAKARPKKQAGRRTGAS